MPILNLFDQISPEVETTNFTLRVCIALSKAYGTINHNILLDKRKSYRILGIVNNWLKSYLGNRHQYVQISESKSQHLKIICGIPKAQF